MRPTKTLLQNMQLTLFTRLNCGLCNTAKNTLAQIRKRPDIEYTEIDIMKPENKVWKDVYEFDVPVLHIQKILSPSERRDVQILSEERKLFHRFSEDEVEKAIEEESQ